MSKPEGKCGTQMSRGLRYQFENIEQQIEAIIVALSFEEDSIESIDELDSLNEECRRIKTEFKNTAASCESDKLLKRFFHVHQRSLIEILESLPDQLTSVSETIVRQIEGIYESLRNEFPEYFDVTLPIPKSLRKDLVVEIQESIEAMAKILTALEIDPVLSKLIINSSETFRSKKPLTYVNISFIRELTFRLMKIKIQEPEVQDQVIKILISINYNEEAFYNYYTDAILSEISTFDSDVEKLDRLYYYFKFFAQAPGLSTQSFDDLAPPINTQLLEWVSQEIEYLKQRFQFQIPNIKTDNITEEFKLNFDLSVSHLAYLFKAFSDSGIIQNKNTSELIRFLSKIVKTKKSESVSYDSFRAKFYNVESSTKEYLKKTLQKMIKNMEGNN